MACTCVASTRLSMILEFVDGRADQRRAGLVPIGNRMIQQFAGLFGQFRQHRREINRQLAEQVQRDRADVLQLCRARRLFAQGPRGFRIDVLIGPIGQRHDQPHGPVVVAVS